MKKLYSLGENWPNLPFHPFSKKLQKTFLTLLLMFSVGFASAQTFTVDSLDYTVTTVGLEVSVKKSESGPTGALTIPSLVTDPNTTIEYIVRAIDNFAFESCDELTYVTIGDSILTIGNEAFANCDSLTNVSLSNSLVSIGGFAFRNCTELNSIYIPNLVTTVGDYAFFGCLL